MPSKPIIGNVMICVLVVNVVVWYKQLRKAVSGKSNGLECKENQNLIFKNNYRY